MNVPRVICIFEGYLTDLYMKVILTGATGYVGEGVLLALLDDSRIEKVLSVGRRPCGHSHARLEEYIVPDKDKMTFIYLSGAGTSDRGMQQWQKIKSSTEREIRGMGFRHAFGWRPMLMKPYPGQTNRQMKAQKSALVLHPLFRLFGGSCTMTEMVNAMYNVATNGYNRVNLEASDIIRAAKKQ